MACVPTLSWMNSHALAQLLLVADDRRLRDADRGLLRQRLHDERERQALGGTRTLRPRRNTVKSGTGMRWYASSFFDSDLSRDSSRPRGLQPGVGHAQQLEVADDVLVEQVDVVEASSRLKTIVGFHSSIAWRIGLSSSWMPSGLTSWPFSSQRRDDVELGLPLGVHDVDAAWCRRAAQVLVDEHEDALAFHRWTPHSATRWPPLCR